jgi:hypothetical protein
MKAVTDTLVLVKIAAIAMGLICATPLWAQEGMISAQVPGTGPVDPANWQKLERVLKINNERFSKHLEGASNISVPMAPKEFSWKINWSAQQKYCKAFAQALFTRSPRVEFAKITASHFRDGVPAVKEAIGKTFPKCTTPKADSFIDLGRTLDNVNRQVKGKEPIDYLPTREFIDSAQDKVGYSNHYILDRDYLIKFYPYIYNENEYIHLEGIDFESSLSDPGNLLLLRVAAYRHPHPMNGCPQRGATGWSTANSGQDSIHGQGTWMPSALLLFDGVPVLVEYGTYQNGREYFELSPEQTRFGTKGQRFVSARPLQHDLWTDWALSKVPRQVRFIDENHIYRGESTRPMDYRACVINFDEKSP